MTMHSTQTYHHDIETEEGKITVRAERGYGDLIEIIVHRDGLDVVLRLTDLRDASTLAGCLSGAANSLFRT